MTREELIALLGTEYPEVKPGAAKHIQEFIVPATQLHALCERLAKKEDTLFDYLSCETAADRKDGFHMIYILASSRFAHTVLLRVVMPDKAQPAVDTVCDIWHSAEYFEREIFDLFGINFNNHPDLRRIFLEEDWVGYPLRKDYKDSFTLVK